MNPYLIIPLGTSTPHLVGTTTKPIIRQIEGNEDAATHPWLVEGKYYTTERILELFTPDYLKFGSTVERRCPNRCYTALDGKQWVNFGLACTICQEGTQTFTVPNNNPELMRITDFLKPLDDETVNEWWIQLEEKFATRDERNPYILVSRDLEACQ